MFRSSPPDRPRWSHAVWFPSPQHVSRRHGATRALAACLAGAALAAPAALADEPRSPDLRAAAATPAHKRADAFTGGVRAPEWLWPDPARTTARATPTTRPRTPDTTAVVKVVARGFDWSSAGFGAGGAIALVIIAVAATATASRRSRPMPH
jgi:hypothetical protein